MSYIADAPLSCQGSYDTDRPMRITGSNLAVPGQTVGSSLVWTGIPEADVEDFLNLICGQPEVTSILGVTVVRIVPLRHPFYPFMIAQSFDCEALPIYDGTTTLWPRYKVSVEFAVPPYSLDGDMPYVSENVSPSSRQIQAPAVATRIGGVSPVYDPGRDVYGQDYTLTAHQLPGLPVSAYMNYVGHTNTGTFLGCPAGTVIYRGPTGERTMSFGAVKSYTISHSFGISEVPWNYGYKPDGTLAQITNADGTLRNGASNLALVFSS